jgi:hypothetical protein
MCVCVCVCVCIHSLLLSRWSTDLFQKVFIIPRSNSYPRTAQHNISNHNKPDIASASRLTDQLSRAYLTGSYTLQLFVCSVNDLAQIKVPFCCDYTATRPYCTAVDLSAPNAVFKHSYTAVRMFTDVIIYGQIESFVIQYTKTCLGMQAVAY